MFNEYYLNMIWSRLGHLHLRSLLNVKHLRSYLRRRNQNHVKNIGGEGLDLRGTKNVVILDPTWNETGLQQIIGRAIRYKSHSHLPPNERKVNVYFMVLTMPDNNTLGLLSGDVLLYDIIDKKTRINKQVEDTLKGVSV